MINNRLDQPAADAVVRICHRLDGLPLALELAAARTNVLSVHQLADTLERELGILQAPGPGGEHELVDAIVGWTYQRLSGTETVDLRAALGVRRWLHQGGGRRGLRRRPR